MGSEHATPGRPGAPSSFPGGKVGDGRRKEKEVSGAGGGSEIFSRFHGYAVWHEREKTTKALEKHASFWISSRTKETSTRAR